MKPPPFEYYAPREPARAVELLAQCEGDAQLLAGGQSLMPLLNFRLADPAAVIDLNQIPGLSHHRVGDHTLTVGALCRDRDIEHDPEVGARCAAIADAVPLIGHVAVRNRGTVVGSLTHADPSAEWSALAVLLNARVEVLSVEGKRSVHGADFFSGSFTTMLSPEEMVTETTFELPPASSGSAFVEFGRRDGDFALVGAGVVLDILPDRVIRSARIALSGVSDRPVRVAGAEGTLEGKLASDDAFAMAAATAAGLVEPPSDTHGTGAYRRSLVETVTHRGLQSALRRSNEEVRS